MIWEIAAIYLMGALTSFFSLLFFFKWINKKFNRFMDGEAVPFAALFWPVGIPLTLFVIVMFWLADWSREFTKK